MNLLGLSGSEIVDTVRNFVVNLFVSLAQQWFWPAIFVGLMLLAVLVMISLVKGSYENKLLKSINKLNKYFLAKPFITEENLVEFNLKMKRVPKTLRNSWQIYMLNREDGPTKYINTSTCVDKPLRSSSIEKHLGNFSIFTILMVVLSFSVGLAYSYKAGIAVVEENLRLLVAVLCPLAVVAIYSIYVLFARLRKNEIYSLLFENFPVFERNLEKAVTTLPAYVDYEILFTKQEIKEGIPILQQYLEKRALVEQKELEKARENSVACEEYDFGDLGIDGSLVLERAMKESETFIKVRKRLQDESDAIEAEKENYKKNFETTSKDLQRKLQASRENLDSLRSQQEASTNRIESNYIRKQQSDEIKKQQQLEKDLEEATTKFNNEQEALEGEIKKREAEIEEKKNFVQQAMLLEFKHYANTLYKALTQKAAEVGNEKLLSLAQENSDLKALLTDLQGVGGMTNEQLDPSTNLIHGEEITTDELYPLNQNNIEEISQSEENAMDGNSDNAGQYAQPQEVNYADQPQPVNTEQNNFETSNQVEGYAPADQQQYEQQSYEDTNAQQPYEQQPYEQQPWQEENPTTDNVQQPEDQQYWAQDTENASNVEQSKEQEKIEDKSKEENIDGTDFFKKDGDDDNDDGDGSNEATADDLQLIQKQIEEENNRLKREREQLEQELNNTISKMDSQAPAGQFNGYNGYNYPQYPQGYPQGYPQYPQGYPQGYGQPYVAPQPQPQQQPQPIVIQMAQPTAQPAPQVEPQPPQSDVPEDQPDVEEVEEIEEEEPSTRPARKERKQSVRGRTSATRGKKTTTRKNNSEIDALNAEMQKLLNSNK